MIIQNLGDLRIFLATQKDVEDSVEIFASSGYPISAELRFEHDFPEDYNIPQKFILIKEMD